jgi:hypothetical protein
MTAANRVLYGLSTLLASHSARTGRADARRELCHATVRIFIGWLPARDRTTIYWTADSVIRTGQNVRHSNYLLPSTSGRISTASRINEHSRQSSRQDLMQIA